MDKRTDTEKALDRFVSDIHNWSTERPIWENSRLDYLRAQMIAYEFHKQTKEKKMQITMQGKYQTEDGRPVEILRTGLYYDGPFNVLGIIWQGDGKCIVEAWTPNGKTTHKGIYNNDLVPVPTKIDICKEYRTRGGAAVDILKTHMKNPDAQIIGIITNEDGSEICESWTEDGRGVSPLRNILADLVPVPEPKPVVHQMWAVMKDGSDTIKYSSYCKQDAEWHCNVFLHETIRLIQWNT